MPVRSLLVALTVAVMAIVISACGRPAPADTAVVFADRLHEVSRLDLAEMTLTKTGSISDLSLDKAEGMLQTATALLNSLKLGTRKGVYSYDTYLRASVDLGDVRPDDIKLDNAGHTAHVVLPGIKVDYSGRDPGIREIHSRVTGLRSRITPAERAALKEVMNEALRHGVSSNPEYEETLRHEAEANGRRFIESLFQSYGYTVTVEYR